MGAVRSVFDLGKYDSVGLDTQFQQGSGVFERYSVVVGFEGDPAAVGGGHATAAADIITGEWKGLGGWLFLLEEVAGPFAHFAVEADVWRPAPSNDALGH